MGKYDYLSDSDIMESVKSCGSRKKAAKALHIPYSSFKELWHARFDKPKSTPEKGEVFKVAAVSDTHIGSIYQQKTAFLDFMEECCIRDVRTLLFPGDVIDGLMGRPEHVHERFLHGIDPIFDYTCEFFDQWIDQFDYVYLQEGNHDATLGRRNYNFNLCHNLSKEYRNVIYSRNPDDLIASYQIDGKIKVILHHGSGNCSQNLVNRTRTATTRFINMRKDFDLLLCGHCHNKSSDYWLGKYAFSLGCFQAITPYLAQKPLIPLVEGGIISYSVDGNGEMTNVIYEPFNYDDRIKKDDY